MESELCVTVGYLCANFSLSVLVLGLTCATDRRQTSDRQTSDIIIA